MKRREMGLVTHHITLIALHELFFYKRCKCKYIRIYKPISNSDVACHYSVSFPDFLKSTHQKGSKEGAACYFFCSVLILSVKYINAF